MQYWLALVGNVRHQYELPVGAATVPLVPLWASGSNYSIGDIVQAGGNVYEAVKDSIGDDVSPIINTDGVWKQVAKEGLRARIGAPMDSAGAATNTGPIFVGVKTSANGTGGLPIATTNHTGEWFPESDVTRIYVTGGNAGDKASVQLLM